MRPEASRRQRRSAAGERGSGRLKLDENKLWPKMRARFKHDPNNNRPRYFGLKPRVKGPPKLTVVAGNAWGSTGMGRRMRR
jgi:hypothetical protein